MKILKELLWLWDLDGLGQLNYYETQIFDAFRDQTSYYSHYLELMTHISLIKAPNLVNTLRDNFIKEFALDEFNFKVIFPIFNVDESPIVIVQRFQEGASNKMNIKLHDLANIQALENHKKMIFEYICSSLRLLFALAKSNSLLLCQAIMKQYPYKILKKILSF